MYIFFFHISLSIYIYTHIHTHAYIEARLGASRLPAAAPAVPVSAASATVSPATNIVDFGGFDSSIILIQRGGIPRSIGSCWKV